MQQIIVDSDWGVDVLQLTSVLLTRPKEYAVVGATVTFGNAAHDQNLRNAGAMLRLLKADERIPRFPGARAPDGQADPPLGDCAHGVNGLAGIAVIDSSYPPSTTSAVDFIINALHNAPEKTVTIIATGPLTNVARAIRKAPEILQKAKEIRSMGGCLRPLHGYRVNEALERIGKQPIARFGNITEYAEFNFQQAPKDAATVFKSRIPVTLFPMDCTHQMTFTAERERRLRTAFSDNHELGSTLAALCAGPRHIDQQKFGIAPTLHDAHTTLSLLRPDLYTEERGYLEIETDSSNEQFGRSKFVPDNKGPHWVARDITAPDEAFDLLLDCLKQTVL